MSGRRGSTDRNFRARSLVRRPCGASARCPAGVSAYEMREVSLADQRARTRGLPSAEPEAIADVVPTPAVRDRRVPPAAAARPDHDPLPDVIEVLERYAATGARTLVSCTPEAGSDQVPFADYRACPGVCNRPPPGLRLPVSFSRVCRSHPRSTRTVSGCACPGHGWTTTSRPLTMHRWQGGYWVPPRPPSSPVSRREPSNVLLPPAANPSNRRWLVGVKDRRATCPMMRSGVARQQSSGLWRRPRALASRPRNQEARLPTCASYFTYRPRKLVAMWIAGQSSG
jgi:hypothetical protein